MTDDITYFYKRGEGWVPARYNQVTAVIEKYNVTIIEKHPERKEFYIVAGEDENLQEYLDTVIRYDRYKFQSDPRWYFSRWTLQCEKSNKNGHYNNYKFFTIKFERIKPPKKVRARTVAAPVQETVNIEQAARDLRRRYRDRTRTR